MARSGAAAGNRGAGGALARFLLAAVPAAGALAAEQAAAPPSVQTTEAPFSFVRAPFVHPRIIQDLTTWLSDTGDQVVAVNLTDANRSNRYHGEVRGSSAGCPNVRWQGPKESFSYRYVGMTDAGVHVLRTRQRTGGTMVAVELLFVVLEFDYGFGYAVLDFEPEGELRVARTDRQRILLRKLGAFGLGDRWDGTLAVRGNDLLVGADRGWFSQAEGHGKERRPRRLLRIEARPSAPLDFAAHPGACGVAPPADG